MGFKEVLSNDDEKTLRNKAAMHTVFAVVALPVALGFGYIWLVNAATGAQSNVTMIFALVGALGVALNAYQASDCRSELRSRGA